MSDRHREALTHLNYGLGGSNSGDNGGFVLLTGEVGTGKTTVSRCLMADLPESTQLAFILNPTLSSQELLATICDQLKIRYRKTGATLKTLTDKISEKLLKNHADNINTLLIVDEAQHLEAEVLEQLRLLTNLETNTKKLLQVILIGQPELQQLLKRRDLRQLAQRITARYHLLPLNQQELVSYIKHRLSVADCHRALFNEGAIKAIHKISQGVPRLINLICHTALMEAYNSNNAVVDKKIVYKAASQVLGEDLKQPIWWQQKPAQLSLVASVLTLFLFAGIWLGQEHQEGAAQVVVQDMQKEVSIPEKAMPEQPVQQSELVPVMKLAESVSDKKEEPLPTKPEPQLVVTSEKNDNSANQVVSNIENKAEQQTYQSKDEVKVVNDNYQLEAVDGISDDLLAKFQAAIDDTEGIDRSNEQPKNQAIDGDIRSLTQMPSWVQNGVPSLKFEQHIYASDGQGWVNVNGRDRYEGDLVAENLTIDKILPQHIIFTYRGETFSLPALTNW